jgi:imidazolonepropionase-like amidohydrolase
LRFEPELARQMAQEGVTVTPTIQLYRDLQRYLLQKRSQQTLTKNEAAYLTILPVVIKEKYRALRGFLDAGVRCVAGNDAGLPHTGFGGLGSELAAMVRGGMTPMQAILSATIDAAKAMGIDQETGSIQAGKKADLLVVSGNPAADIDQITAVRKVLQAGKVVFDPSKNTQIHER